MNLPKSRKKRRVPTSTPERISIFRKWVKEHTLQIIIGFFIILAILLVLGLAYQRWILGLRNWADCTGFAEYTGNVPKDDRGKTLWDWMELLIIPVVLAFGAFFFNKSERDNDRKIAEERIKSEQRVALDRQREITLQSYLDKMTELLLRENGGLRESPSNSEVRIVARTRTLTTIRSLDGIRKGLIIQFLYEADLIGCRNTILILNEANLTGIDLQKAFLFSAQINYASMESANFSYSNLARVDFSFNNLQRSIFI